MDQQPKIEEGQPAVKSDNSRMMGKLLMVAILMFGF